MLQPNISCVAPDCFSKSALHFSRQYIFLCGLGKVFLYKVFHKKFGKFVKIAAFWLHDQNEKVTETFYQNAFISSHFYGRTKKDWFTWFQEEKLNNFIIRRAVSYFCSNIWPREKIVKNRHFNLSNGEKLSKKIVK